MWKAAQAIVICALIPLLWQPLRGQTPSVGVKARSKQENVPPNSPSQTPSGQRGTKDVPLVVDIEEHKDTPAEAKEKRREKEQKDRIDARTLLSAEITAGATVVLMFVGFGGVWAALWTLNAIRRQVALQELTLEQWVDYGNFRSEYRANDSGRQLLVISMELINPSNFPVILPDAKLVFEMGTTKITSQPGGSICRLLPNKPHRLTVGFELTRDQAEQYAHGAGLAVRVSGNIAHIGTLKERHEQPISGMLMCHERMTRFEEETPRKDSDQGQRPN
jgi:hypothetical protein